MLGNGKHVASFDMSVIWDRFQIFDNDASETSGLAEFSTELKKIQ